jgi:hypothetical protein
MRPPGSCPAGSQAAAGFRRQRIPALTTEAARSLAPPLRAFSSTACRTVRGPPGSGALLRAEAGAKDQASLCFCCSLLRAGARCFTRVPISGGGRWTDQPAGARARCARVRCRHRDMPSANPGQRSRTQRAGARWASLLGCLSLWLLSLLARKEKVTRLQGCRRNPQGRESVSRENTKSKERKANTIPTQPLAHPALASPVRTSLCGRSPARDA